LIPGEFHGKTPGGRLFDVNRRAISEAAARWFSRRRSGHWRETDEIELARWLDSSPQCRREFDAFQSVWSDLDQVKDAVAPEKHLPPAANSWLRWQTWSPAAVCALLIAVCIGLFYHYQSAHPIFTKALATSVRQRIESTLPDGSKLALNVNSQAQVTFYRDHRAVSLSRGEAFFDVAHDEERPFAVRTKNGTIRVVGTQFNVQIASEDVRVSVLRGRVEVSGSNDKRPPVPLVVGEAAKLSERVTRFAVVASDIGAWRAGQVIFRNQPLAEVLKEVGRYRTEPIVLASDTLGKRRLSGVFNIDNPESFLDALPQILPVAIRRKPDGTVLVTVKN
jgi:transmembrane sensor